EDWWRAASSAPQLHAICLLGERLAIVLQFRSSTAGSGRRESGGKAPVLVSFVSCAAPVAARRTAPVAGVCATFAWCGDALSPGVRRAAHARILAVVDHPSHSRVGGNADGLVV